jgi:hypothetical protein
MGDLLGEVAWRVVHDDHEMVLAVSLAQMLQERLQAAPGHARGMYEQKLSPVAGSTAA